MPYLSCQAINRSIDRSFLDSTPARYWLTKTLLLEVRSRQRLHHTRALGEPGAEDAVGVLEHAILERDDDELGALEARLDETADVLRVRQVEGCVDLVEDVHGSWLKLQKSHDEREGDEGSTNLTLECGLILGLAGGQMYQDGHRKRGGEMTNR